MDIRLKELKKYVSLDEEVQTDGEDENDITINMDVFEQTRQGASSQAALSAMARADGLANARVRVEHSSHVVVGHTYINHQSVRSDQVVKDVTLRQYISKVVKSSTRWERLFCVCIFFLVLFALVLILNCVVIVRKVDPADEAPDWFVSRELWDALPHPSELMQYVPSRMVVVQHSVTPECHTFFACAAAIRIIQKTFLNEKDMDIPYNFLIGNDGYVYEGRGWGKIGSNSLRFDPCSISIGFIGDYRSTEVTKQQLNRTKLLLKEGVEQGHISPGYALVGAKDIRSTASPGTNLYHQIQKLEHYDHENRYRDMICEQIYADSEHYYDWAPHEWYITRKQWGALASPNLNVTSYRPARLVVINNSESRVCYTFAVCEIELRHLQTYFHRSNIEIPYNFAVGNDGRVYEVRGWGTEPGGNMRDTPCALNIGFIGDYAYNASLQTKVSANQVTSIEKLLKMGVEEGHIHQDYLVVGAKDVALTASPGGRLYDEIQTWARYDLDSKLKYLDCDQIQALP